MNVIQDLLNSLNINTTNNAFCINDVFYTYQDLSDCIAKIQIELQQKVGINENNIGLMAHNDLETYAAIFAIWLEGKAYIPLNPETPKKRNLNVIEQSEIKTIIDSSQQSQYLEYQVIQSTHLKQSTTTLTLNNYSENHLAYIFFTSGTTGAPKGVQITQRNINYFTQAFWELNYTIDSTDKCLQMFDLTFDLSVVSFLSPLLKGACVYTISNTNIKYLEVLRIISSYNLTFTLMVPSVLHALRPYFKKINCKALQFSLFCGEALHLDITEAWSNCVPNATIANVYGPTECTIYCTNYIYNKQGANKSHNGILSVGTEMAHTKTIIIDENTNIIDNNEPGELCLSGPQLTVGYWKNESINKKSFFYKNQNDEQIRYYKTGDLCRRDADGDIIYLGRIDFQAKIQGYRVELSEIEFHLKKIIPNINLVTVVFFNKLNNAELALAIESSEFDINPYIDKLKLNLPSYMIPTKSIFFKTLPLNSNGKTNRKDIIKIVEEQYG